jgi:hypothetical protein
MNYKFVRGILMIGVLALFITIAHGLNAQAQDVAPASETVDMPDAGDLVAANDSLGGVFGVSETGRYIIQLEDPAVPSYTGGIAGLEATSPQVTGESRLNANTPAVQAYISYLHSKQDELLADMNATLGRSVELVFRYESAMNGLAVVMSHEEALEVSQLPGVKAVFGEIEEELATDVGPWFLGAPSIWFGDTGSGVATRGEGIIVGIIDTGVNFEHPSFAATDGDGYTHTNPYGAGVYNGWCATNAGCNEKLIGAYGLNPAGGNPADDHGHGSHTGSTAAGNLHDAVFDVGGETFTLTVAGVAPRANQVHYKVCTPGCPQAASVAAVNHAINDDMVDVLNYSISGIDNPWNDAVDIAFLEGFNAGIYIAASAGNSGPGPSTVAKTGPWNASTAASTINRIIAHTVDVVGPTTPPELQDMAAVPGENVSITTDITEEIRYNAGNPQGCNPGHPAGFFDDSIALVIRGACTFAEKVNNAAAAGAEAVIVFNHVGGPPISMGATPATPPSVMIDNANGIDLRDYIIANPGAEVTINAQTAISYNDDWENVVAGFSSRGPSQFEMLAPTFIAPGVNTLAAGNSGPGDYYFSQGTSMSSPHAAGAGALLMALNPTWSPAEVRSALAMTANPDGLVKEDGSTPADWFDIGSGLLDLTAAGNIGLVMDETYDNFVDANPDIGGDPKTLNLPAFLNYNCTGECSWTRTVTSVAQDPITYTAVVDVPVGMTITVDPVSFTIDPGASQLLTVTVDVDGMAIGDFAFADIQLVPQAGSLNELLNESFTDETFPPTNWEVHWLEGTGTRDWRRDTAQSNSPPASAQRQYSFPADGPQDSWLVTPPLTTTLDGLSLSYYDRGAFMAWYGYSGVWVSTGSCDPEDGEFVELLETDDMTATWRQVTIDLSAYAGQTACIAFRYGGGDAHDWWIDDVVVQESELAAVAAVHMPVAVIPALAAPVITVDPDELSATQDPDTVTNQTLTIGNAGGVDLDWEIAEAPVAMRLGLTLEDSNAPASSPMSFILDDGVGENAVGLTGGAQFLWFNRFTPNSFNFPITIDTVDVMYGYPGSTGGINVGELVDIYLYEDADGNPANGADHVASLHDQAVQAVDGVTWSTYTFTTPVTFNGPGDILIAVVNRTAGVTASTFPAVIDQTPPSQQRSWIGFGAVPGDPPVMPMPTFGVIDGFGLAGNWMVRGFGTGNIPCDNPANVSWLDVDPDMGTTTPGSTTDVTVTFDSTGLTPGEYNALLCVDSNDPDTPLVEVLVTLEVAIPLDPPVIDVDPDTIESTQVVDSQTTHTLDISNLGEADLEWFFGVDGPTVLYDNGPFITSFGNGPGGSDVSLLQNVSLGMTTLGASVNLSGAGPHFRIADEFTVTDAAGLTIDQAVFYAYQTGSSTTSSFTGVNYQIWDGPPNDAGSAVIFGDTTANRIEATGWTGVYRYAENNIGNTQRPVMYVVGESGVHLPAGDYWIDWQLAGSIASGPWQPPITHIGQTTTGNALQLASTGWQPFLDGGTGTAQGAPFQLWGPPEFDCDDPADLSWVDVSPDSGTTPGGEIDQVEVTLDATGVAPGSYTANLCILSNDPDTPVVVVPVTMTVVEPSAYLAVAHLAPFAMDPGTAVTITLNGAPALTDFAYGDSTGYIELPAGDYDVEVWPAGSSSPAITGTISLMPNGYYSAIAIGDGVNQDLGLVLLEDDNSAPAAGYFKIRLGHLAPFAAGGATADVRLADGTPVATDVDFGDITGYLELPAGTYDLIITAPGGSPTLINPEPVTFADGDIITAFATGDGSNQDLGVFAWPPDTMGFFLPLGEIGTTLYLPIIMKN